MLIGPDAYELDGGGRRAHWWGTDWWPAPLVSPLAAGEAKETGRSLARLPAPGQPAIVERRLTVADGQPRW